MYRCVTAAFALACFGSFAPSACAAAGANEPLIRELQAVNAKLVDATRRKDIKATMALMTPDFQMKKMQGGWLNRAQTEALLRKSWPTIVGFRTWRIGVRNAKSAGNSATALVEDRVEADVKDTKGLIRTIVMQTIAKEEWTRVNGTWKFRRMEDVKSQIAASGPAYVPWKQALGTAKAAAARAKKGPKPGIKAADARRLLESSYAASRKAFRAKDVAGVMASATPDYTVEYPSRSSSRWQVEQDLRKDLKSTKSIKSWSTTIGAINVTGNTFTAEITERKNWVLVDGSGKPHTSDVVDTMRDVWVKTPTGWRNRKTIMLGATVKVDGRLQEE